MIIGDDKKAELEAMFLEMAHEALDAMREKAQAGEVPMQQVHEAKFEVNAYYTISTPRPLYRILLNFPTQIGEVSDTTKNCVRAHLDAGLVETPNFSDNAGNRILDVGFDMAAPVIAQQFYSMISQVIDKAGSLEPSDEELLLCHRFHMGIWNGGPIEEEVVVPLFNTTGDIQPFALDEEAEIAELSDTEKGRIWNPHFSNHLLPAHDLMGVRHKIHLARISQLDAPFLTREAGEVALRIITTLRLHQKGRIGVRGYFSRRKVAYHGNEWGAGSWGWAQLQRGVSGYKFEQDDSVRIQHLHRTIYGGELGSKRRSLDVGLRRFNQAYSRRDIEDQIIDYAIALDSLLVPDGQTELTHRLAQRGAFLLAESCEPQETYKNLVALYTARSKIVHEGQLLSEMKHLRNASDVSPLDLPAKADDLVRNILKELIKRITRHESLRQLVTDLDMQLLNRMTIEAKEQDEDSDQKE